MSLKIKDKLPEFTAKDSFGNRWNSKSLFGHWAVVYFYPKDFTPGCTKQACGFGDRYDELTAMGVKIIGISSDSVESHRKFKKRYAIPFTLLSDSKKEIRRKFGVRGHLFGIIPGRETFIFDKNGILQDKFRDIKPSGHLENTLKTIKRLKHED